MERPVGDPQDIGDIELMLQIRDDDAKAFACLMERHRPRLTAFFRNLCEDELLAEDLFQETFIRLWSARHRYEPTARFSTFLFHIARNLWPSERPRWQRRREFSSLDEPGKEGRPNAEETVVADLRNLPKAVLLQKERDRRVHEAVRALPASLRTVFVLAHMEGCRYSEVAQMLGIAEGTVKWRISEAVRKLRHELREEFVDELPESVRESLRCASTR